MLVHMYTVCVCPQEGPVEKLESLTGGVLGSLNFRRNYPEIK